MPRIEHRGRKPAARLAIVIPPTIERIRKAEDDADLTVAATVVDGTKAVVYRARDTLDQMRDRNPPSISQEQWIAGRQFEAAFHVSRLDGMKCGKWEYSSPSGRREIYDLPDRVIDARNKVAAAVNACGGHGSLLSIVLWNVVGLGMPLSALGGTQALCEKGWRGILIAALDVLVRLETARK